MPDPQPDITMLMAAVLQYGVSLSAFLPLSEGNPKHQAARERAAAYYAEVERAAHRLVAETRSQTADAMWRLFDRATSVEDASDKLATFVDEAQDAERAALAAAEGAQNLKERNAL